MTKDDLTIHNVNLEAKINLSKVAAENIEVQIGGHWSPTNCIPRQKVAVILPYRNRENHLHTLLKRLHPMLRKQKIHYTIFIITQVCIALCILN